MIYPRIIKKNLILSFDQSTVGSAKISHIAQYLIPARDTLRKPQIGIALFKIVGDEGLRRSPV